MKWFDTVEFDKVRKLIDEGNNAKAIGEWYWNSDFKNNATTLAMAFIYTMMNKNKCTICAKKLKDLLVNKDKTSPLEYNDVVSEIWKHDNVKAITSLNILVDNEIPFAIKDGDVLAEFLTNPKLKKISDAIEKNPQYISTYMTKTESDKVQKKLLASDNYDLVKKGLSTDEYIAIHGPKYRKRNLPVTAPGIRMKQLLEKTVDIKNRENRLKYIKEVIFGNRLQSIHNVFDVLKTIYISTDFIADDIVDILKKLSPQNVGSGTASDLFFYMHNNGDKEAIKKITKNSESNIWFPIILAIKYMNSIEDSTNVKYKSDWISDYIPLLSKDNAKILLDYSDTGEFINKFLEIYPEELDNLIRQHPDKLPKTVKDIFCF